MYYIILTDNILTGNLNTANLRIFILSCFVNLKIKSFPKIGQKIHDKLKNFENTDWLFLE